MSDGGGRSSRVEPAAGVRRTFRLLVAFGLSSVLPLVAQAESSYVVRDGDTLAEIAEENGMEYEELAYRNDLDNVDLIFIGQVLVIPEPAVRPPRHLIWRYTSKWARTRKARRLVDYDPTLNAVNVNPEAAPLSIQMTPTPPGPSKAPESTSVPPTPPASAPPQGPCALEFRVGAKQGTYWLQYDGPLLGLRVHGFGRVYFAYAVDDSIIVDSGSKYVGLQPVPAEWLPIFERYRGLSLSAPSPIRLSQGCD